MEKKNNTDMIGNMPFEEYNKLPYKEQCEYISTLKPVKTEGVDDMPIQYVEIDCTIDEYVAKYHLISFDELMQNINDIQEKSMKEHGFN